MKTPSHFLVLPLLLSLLSCSNNDLTDKEVEWTDSVHHFEDYLKAIENSSLIILGEFSHGTAEITQLQSRLIEHINHRYGINLVLFESGIGEVETINQLSDKNCKQGVYALIGPWMTVDHAQLLCQLKSLQIDVAGFDVQRSGNSFAQSQNLSKKHQPQLLELENKYTRTLNALKNNDFQANDIHDLIAEFEGFQSIFLKNSFTHQVLKNRIKQLHMGLDFAQKSDWVKRFSSRDAAMAENVLWHLKGFVEGGKTVLITHNYHAKYKNKLHKNMVQLVHESYSGKLYTTGIYAYSGAYHDNAFNDVSMKELSDAADIRHYMRHQVNVPTFIDLFELTKNQAELLVKVYDSFVSLDEDNTIDLKQQFDGAFVIEQVSPSVPFKGH